MFGDSLLGGILVAIENQYICSRTEKIKWEEKKWGGRKEEQQRER